MAHSTETSRRTSPHLRFLGIINTDQLVTDGLTKGAYIPDLMHAQEPLVSLFDNASNVLVIPNAAGNRDAAFNRHSAALANVAGARSFLRLDTMMNLTESEIIKNLKRVEALYATGGNTFTLSDEMYNSSFPWAQRLSEMVKEGLPYAGVSAGTLMAQDRFEVCFDDRVVPSDKGFGFLNLNNTQIGVHFESEDNHGPSVEDLQPFVTESRAVLALNDGTWLRAEQGRLHFEGVEGMRALMMKSGQPNQSIPVGTDLSYLLV